MTVAYLYNGCCCLEWCTQVVEFHCTSKCALATTQTASQEHVTVRKSKPLTSFCQESAKSYMAVYQLRQHCLDINSCCPTNDHPRCNTVASQRTWPICGLFTVTLAPFSVTRRNTCCANYFLDIKHLRKIRRRDSWRIPKICQVDRIPGYFVVN